ncbi:UNVERIFIED_CONTAM: hypothetical protein FKN15_060383 [Acipenser sinensis]
MSGSIVVFLGTVELVSTVVEKGIVVNNTFLPVIPLAVPARKITLSNVPPFLKNEVIERELARYGQLMSGLKRIPLGCKSPHLKHVMSFRRQLFMILKNIDDDLNITLKFKVDGSDYVIYATSDSMKCFRCGTEGHLVKNCPEKESRERDGSNGDETADKQKPGPAGAGLAGGSVPAGSSEGEQASDGGAAEPQEAGSDAVLGAESQTKAQDTAKDNESAESHGTEGESEKMDTETVASVWGDVQIQVEGVKFAEDSEAFRLPGRKRVSKTEGSAVTKKRSVSSDGSSVGMEPGSSAETSSAQAVSTVTDNPAVDSEDEGSLTDSSQASQSLGAYKPRGGYSVQSIKDFLEQTKGRRGIDVEDFFPDIDLFLSSVRGLKQIVSAQETFSTQELVRLKYISSKLRGNVKHSQS